MKDNLSPIPHASGEEIHIRAITLRIAGIKKEIGEEMRLPAPDVLRLSKLKCQKLYLKDKARRVLKARTSARCRRSRASSHLTPVSPRDD